MANAHKAQAMVKAGYNYSTLHKALIKTQIQKAQAIIPSINSKLWQNQQNRQIPQKGTQSMVKQN